jgi:hypothetical protein
LAGGLDKKLVEKSKYYFHEPLRLTRLDVDDLARVLTLNWVRCEVADSPNRVHIRGNVGLQDLSFQEFVDFRIETSLFDSTIVKHALQQASAQGGAGLRTYVQDCVRLVQIGGVACRHVGRDR